MPVRFSFRRWWSFPTTALLVCAVFTLPAGAQELGTTADEAAFTSITVRPKFLELVRKTKDYDPKSKEHADYLEKAAKYYVYPVTWSAVLLLPWSLSTTWSVPNWLLTVTAAWMEARMSKISPRVTVSLPPLVSTVTGVVAAVPSTTIRLPPSSPSGRPLLPQDQA